MYHRIAHFSELSTQEELSIPWTTAYQGIARHELILDRLDNLEDQQVASRIQGEALFIRSLFYYHLAVLWGNVPLQIEAVTSPNVEVNQVGADVVYAQIAGDLETAQGLLPASYSGADVGRATSGAANTLLGLVYLTNGQSAPAAEALRRVVSSGPVFAGAQLRRSLGRGQREQRRVRVRAPVQGGRHRDRKPVHRLLHARSGDPAGSAPATRPRCSRRASTRSTRCST